MAKRYRRVDTNKNAHVRTRTTRNGKIRTETAYRDENSCFNVAASTTPRDNSTKLFIDTFDGCVTLSGREARTLLRVLVKHCEALDKNIYT